jgi:hypothetical protein
MATVGDSGRHLRMATPVGAFKRREVPMVALALSPFDDEASTHTQARTAPRVRFNESACYLSDARIVIARAGDVSMSGAFIETDHPDPQGTRAVVRLEHGGELVVIDAEVRRVSFLSTPGGNGRGMGLSFSGLTPEKRRFLARYVAAHHST